MPVIAIVGGAPNIRKALGKSMAGYLTDGERVYKHLDMDEIIRLNFIENLVPFGDMPSKELDQGMIDMYRGSFSSYFDKYWARSMISLLARNAQIGIVDFIITGLKTRAEYDVFNTELQAHMIYLTNGDTEDSEFTSMDKRFWSHVILPDFDQIPDITRDLCDGYLRDREFPNGFPTSEQKKELKKKEENKAMDFSYA